VTRTRALAASALAVAALLSGCSSSGSGDGTSGFVAGDGSTVLTTPDQRSAAPAVSGTTLDGAPLDLGTLRGKVVVVNFWASWCGPCRTETSALEQVYTQEKDKGVAFVGVVSAGKDSLANAQAFTRTFDVSYPSIFDKDNSVVLAFHGALSPAAIPTTLVLDRQGRVAARALDAVDKSRLLGMIEPVLAEKA